MSLLGEVLPLVEESENSKKKKNEKGVISPEQNQVGIGKTFAKIIVNYVIEKVTMYNVKYFKHIC